MLYFFQQVLNGLHASAIYALLAFGYALTNGVIRRTNLAYGALFAFSGQAMILVAVFGWYVLVADLAGNGGAGHRSRLRLCRSGQQHPLARGVCAARREFAQHDRGGDIGRLAGTDGTGADCRRNPRLLAAADAGRTRGLRLGRWLPRHLDGHPAGQLRGRRRGDPGPDGSALPLHVRPAFAGCFRRSGGGKRCAASTCGAFFIWR